jgi:hypothetical protein
MSPDDKKELRKRIDTGIKQAVVDALEEHARAGRQVAIWEDGQVKIVPARKLVRRKRRAAK